MFKIGAVTTVEFLLCFGSHLWNIIIIIIIVVVVNGFVWCFSKKKKKKGKK